MTTPPASPPITLVNTWSANGGSPNAPAVTVNPNRVGDLMVICFGQNVASQFATGVTGGGVAQWQRAAGVVTTTSVQGNEIWWGVVTQTGSQAVTMQHPMSNWWRLQVRQFTAGNAAWSRAAGSPVAETVAFSVGQAMTFPALAAAGLYVGSGLVFWNNAPSGWTGAPPWNWATFNNVLVSLWRLDYPAGTAPPTVTMIDSAQRWSTCGAVFAAVATAPAEPVTRAWNGTAWVTGQRRGWTGSQWRTARVWDGSQWR